MIKCYSQCRIQSDVNNVYLQNSCRFPFLVVINTQRWEEQWRKEKVGTCTTICSTNKLSQYALKLSSVPPSWVFSQSCWHKFLMVQSGKHQEKTKDILVTDSVGDNCRCSHFLFFGSRTIGWLSTGCSKGHCIGSWESPNCWGHQSSSFLGNAGPCLCWWYGLQRGIQVGGRCSHCCFDGTYICIVIASTTINKG